MYKRAQCTIKRGAVIHNTSKIPNLNRNKQQWRLTEIYNYS